MDPSDVYPDLLGGALSHSASALPSWGRCLPPGRWSRLAVPSGALLRRPTAVSGICACCASRKVQPGNWHGPAGRQRRTGSGWPRRT